MKRLLLRAWLGGWFLGAGLVCADELQQAMTLAQETLQFVQHSRPCPPLAARLEELNGQAARLPADAASERAELAAAVRQVRRQIILSHPLLDFDKLLVNQHPPPGYSHQSRQYLGRYSRPGPGLVVLDGWKDKPTERSW